MTSEEINVAIARLQVLTEANVITALTGEYGWTDKKVREHLIDLLEQADPDTHMELPVDADGVPIHVGDRVVEHEDGHDFVVDGYEYDGKWWVFHSNGINAPANICTHYHKPTVSEILDELEGLRGTGDYEAVVMRAAELAGQLRELIDSDE